MIGHCAALFVENLVMEQADSGECHGNAIFVTGCNNMIVTNRTAWLGDVFHSALMSTFHIISKWEECIGTKRNVGVFI